MCFFNYCTIISNCLSKHKFNDDINEYLQPLFNEKMEIEQCDNKQTVTFNILSNSFQLFNFHPKNVKRISARYILHPSLYISQTCSYMATVFGLDMLTKQQLSEKVNPSFLVKSLTQSTNSKRAGG